MRIGIGYDIHPLVPGRKLILGGVDIPFDRGLDGWSDADTLAHAVMDALLGAAALGDIGVHFPPGEAAYRGISSLILLERVREKLAAAGFRPVNIDATILSEAPKLQGFIPAMREKLANLQADLRNEPESLSREQRPVAADASEPAAAPFDAERRRVQMDLRSQQDILAQIDREVKQHESEKKHLEDEKGRLFERRQGFLMQQQELASAKGDLNVW